MRYIIFSAFMIMATIILLCLAPPLKKEVKPKTLPEVLVQNMKDNPRDWILSDSVMFKNYIEGWTLTNTYITYYVNKKCNIVLSFKTIQKVKDFPELITDEMEMSEPDSARFVSNDFDLIFNQIKLNENNKKDSIGNIQTEKERIRQDLIARKLSICK